MRGAPKVRSLGPCYFYMHKCQLRYGASCFYMRMILLYLSQGYVVLLCYVNDMLC